MYSFGKTLHITGWRVGYCVAPPLLTRELRKVHQFNAFSIAGAAAGRPSRSIYSGIRTRGASWRRSSAPSATCCAQRLAGSGLVLPPAQGTYFQLADYRQLDRAT